MHIYAIYVNSKFELKIYTKYKNSIYILFSSKQLMEIKLYNTLSRSKEDFVPIDPSLVKIYTCGPTVYSTQHMWNMRAAFVMDLLRCVMKTIGWYKVKHIMNITDVWHLTWDNEWDASQWEDRMEKWARKEWTTAWEVAKKFTRIYISDLKYLGIPVSTDMTADFESQVLMPRATDHIQQQIEMIQQMESKWHTYVVDGDGVYMDTSTMPWYGALLSKKHLEWLEEWSRVDLWAKRNATDFALWKFNMSWKKRDMERESPRWIGFPGWHIECSAMSIEYLWAQFDIHMWGMEHIAVHHTNEIAQAECSCSSSPWVNYWIHYQWLMMNGTKISKSTGNVAFVSDAKEKWYSGKDIRFFFLQAHYRSFHDFTWKWLRAAKFSRENLISKLASHLEKNDLDDRNTFEGANLYQVLCTVLADDLDTVQTLAMIHVSSKNPSCEDIIDILLFDQHILKLWLLHSVRELLAKKDEVFDIPQEVIDVAEDRMKAKKNKNYELADDMRTELIWLWRIVKDVAWGYELTPVE